MKSLWSWPIAILLISILLLSAIEASGAEAVGVKEVAPKEADRILSGNPRAVLIDVRSQAEYQFVGHPSKAYNIPMMFWNPGRYDFEPNPRFAEDLTSRFTKDVPLLFICRSGGRSEKAAMEAVTLGYHEVYNVIEGFEGETDSQGLRSVNGWKNSGLPYTYEVEEGLRYPGSGQKP